MKCGRILSMYLYKDPWLPQFHTRISQMWISDTKHCGTWRGIVGS